MTTKAFIDRHKVKPIDFIRTRKLSFEKVFLILINFLTKSLQCDLDNLFKVILNKEIPVKEVTKGAFNLARKKLRYQDFIELNKDQLTYFTKKTLI